jgi:membrane glycosyltransferase
MDATRAPRLRRPLRQAGLADTGGGSAPATTGAAGRARLREERHPNSVTAPPIHRGSMPTQPWVGFWAGIGLGLRGLAARLLGWAPAPAGRGPRQPWERAAVRRRAAFAGIAVLSSMVATVLFAQARPEGGDPWLLAGQLALFAALSAWVVTGFVTALMGFWVQLRGDAHGLSAASVRSHTLGADVRTAVIMPICEEHVSTVFAGLRATCESLAATGQAAQFDVFVLSDSRDPATLAAERAAWEQLRAALAAQGGSQPEVYYRARRRRTHRKAGNVADFCRRWGKDYRYMVVLDADSVMSGDCLVTLAKLMEANPRAGIVQTATQPIGHVTVHARAQQFAARVTGRLFTLGLAFWQLGESHYWGHNAIIRTEAFMRHCGLAPIRGTGGLAGGIMSHDFVEAALIRRAGWQVWLVPDLAGSYEQQPPDLLSELQRDRRWCQGNLQNARLMAEPGIHRVHRAMFFIGAMSYLAAPLWLAFLVVGTGLWLGGALVAGDVAQAPWELLALWAWTLCMLFLPRVLGLAGVLLRGEQRAFGGTSRLLASALAETALALLQAPVRMLAHTLFVVVALTGIKLHWTSPPREARGLAWGDAARQLLPLSGVVLALACGVSWVDPHALVSLLPVALPLALSVPLAVASSHVGIGAWLRHRGLLLIPEESWSPAVLRRARLHGRQARLAAGAA